MAYPREMKLRWAAQDVTLTAVSIPSRKRDRYFQWAAGARTISGLLSGIKTTGGRHAPRYIAVCLAA
jgi:hypothetical protein